MTHRLIDGSLKAERDGVAARCECGWVSAGHFSSLAASAAFQDHKEQEHQRELAGIDAAGDRLVDG